VLGQRFILHMAVWLDFSHAGKTDDIADTVSYADLITVTEKAFTSEWFYLLEKGAEKIAQAMFVAFQAIQQVEITIEKPGAPIASVFDTVGVSIIRKRTA
jgi:7,8-dihydroneopterin aldolase/epimerase/oxygenase